MAQVLPPVAQGEGGPHDAHGLRPRRLQASFGQGRLPGLHGGGDGAVRGAGLEQGILDGAIVAPRSMASPDSPATTRGSPPCTSRRPSRAGRSVSAAIGCRVARIRDLSRRRPLAASPAGGEDEPAGEIAAGHRPATFAAGDGEGGGDDAVGLRLQGHEGRRRDGGGDGQGRTSAWDSPVRRAAVTARCSSWRSKAAPGASGTSAIWSPCTSRRASGRRCRRR